LPNPNAMIVAGCGKHLSVWMHSQSGKNGGLQQVLLAEHLDHPRLPFALERLVGPTEAIGSRHEREPGDTG